MPDETPRRRATGRWRQGRQEETAPAPAYVEDEVTWDPHAEIRTEVVPGPSAGEIEIHVHADDDPRPSSAMLLTVALVVASGLACLIAALVPLGPPWLDRVGAVCVITAYSWALAERTGGRPFVFGTAALALGVVVSVADQESARTGAAVMTCVVSAVLAVMITVPAKRPLAIARECTIAVSVASVGALATVGFSPVLSLSRFEVVSLILSLIFVLALIYRLGAGWHGLGPRGLAAVIVGGVIVTIGVVYAELLRHYGPPGLVGNLLDGVRWTRDHLGAFPRPILAGLGVPALAWGVHMRTRRRQGWWLCAFGVAGTAAVANSAINPAISLRESGLSVLYALILGLMLALAVIKVDLSLTPGGSGARRARTVDEADTARPEPPRTAPLL